ncbi:hypothetical protein Dsin_006914 [Dipteronia sinensis]|uniref:START domain-containing protein n=1 Tax=Dipteronia sinensis TaxID=43782 RepID=A0AAE0B0H1_9ROSI|nr:hypothetical protein Dsin_006914 [Dipteronia sinensis]
MEKRKISQYRERLDKTLASPELINKETLKTLVKNQLLHSSQDEIGGLSENVIERKTIEVSNFLGMLRSASVNETEASKTSEASRGEWKLKQDGEEFRVMYREGPEGTPFHNLLVEGYVEGPIDTCLCISWESTLYKKWWPQSSFPPFKITSCQCLQKVRIGEQISLVRVKVTWPLSAREAIVHYFLFEYIQDDLIVVLLNSISDLKSIDKSTHGFTSDGIPEVKDVVRIDFVGGFALQKVTPERSFFRTIATMDIKLDFVPPSLINFLSRQLVGNGFRLYQKAVASVSTCDEDYRKALEDPLYTHIREILYPTNISSESPTANELTYDHSILPKEQFIEIIPDGLNYIEQEVHNIDHTCESLPKEAQVSQRKIISEIEEEKNEESSYLESEIDEEESKKSTHLEEDGKCNGIDQSLTNDMPEKCHVKGKRNTFISHEVEQALKTLDKAIFMVRENGFNRRTKFSSGLNNEELLNTDMGDMKDLTPLEEAACSTVEVTKEEIIEKTHQEPTNNSGVQDISRRSGSNRYTREGNHNRIAPASPEQHISSPSETNEVALNSSQNGVTERSISNQNMYDNKQTGTEAIVIHESTVHGGKNFSRQKKHRYCCFFFSSA